MNQAISELRLSPLDKITVLLKQQYIWICLFLCVVSIMGFWPGFMSMDSNSLLHQAQNHYYKEGHSPILGYLWHWLLFIFPYKGSGLLVVNQLLLWGAVFFGGQSFKKPIWKIYYLLLPFLPHFLLYSGFIWKDVFFSQGYLCIAMFFANKMIKNESIKPYQWAIILFGVIVFTGAKYQARFALPFLVLLGAFTINRKTLKLNLLLAAGITLSLVSISDTINDKLVGQQHQTHFWQFVKIYDLAGISVYADENVVPRFLWGKDNVEVSDIQGKYTFLWEPLIRESDSPLKETQSDVERQALRMTWFKAVFQHPWSYLKHRFQVWKGNLFINPLGNFFDEKFGHLVWSRVVKPFGYLTCFAILLPLLLFQIVTNVRWIKKSNLSPSIFFNLLSLSVLSALFVFSLSSTPRYIFFTNCFFWFGVPFWFKAWQDNKKERA